MIMEIQEDYCLDSTNMYSNHNNLKIIISSIPEIATNTI